MGKIYDALEKTGNSKLETQVPVPEIEEAQGFEETLESEADEFVEKLDNRPEEGTSQQALIPQHLDKSLVTVLEPYSPVAEQFRLLKNNILFPDSGQPPRSIMVTSPSPGEGKSFVTANLAASIAQSIDEYVLLIDCDLRSPTVHKIFGFEGQKIAGLSDYLSNGMALSKALKKTSIHKLTILPAGRIPSNPSELLSSEQMRRMLNEVKLRYNDRYILIDTPPPYITSETNAIARHVDGIILVTRQGKTRLKEVRDIVQIYGKDNILGVISNFSRKSAGYGYGYHKYGYGYHK